MYRCIILLFFVVRVRPEPKTYQHEYYISRQSKDNAAPLQTGYVFSKMDDKPPSYQTLGNNPSALSETVKIHSDIPTQSDSDNYIRSLSRKFKGMSAMHKEPFKMLSTVGSMFTGATESILPFTTKPWTKHTIDYEIAKAKSKYGLNPTMSIKTDKDYMKERVTNIESYSTPAYTDIRPQYDFSREFHIDDDDVKTLSGTTLDWWPYFMHSPYEYENMKMEQKIKEKRYAISSADRIIPVHEHEEDYSHGYVPDHVHPHYDSSAPMIGVGETPTARDDGYISYSIQDYGNNYDSDPLELSFGNAFDTNDDVHNTGKRNRRLDNLNHSDKNAKVNEFSAALRDSSTEKAYEKKHEFKKHESGDSKNNNYHKDRAVSENNASGFKDAVDQFANTYGGEDHKKHSSYSLKKNSDNGEKRKGFRRVYHKDEYQEDNEFFDNTNNSANAEDSGSSIAHLGGSTAAVHSHAAAAAGNKANSLNEIENIKKNQFENNHKGHDAKKGLDRDSNRYRDIAQNTANRDYTYYYP